MARLQNRNIEVLSARAADSTTYALPSGELRTEAYTGPIRVKQDGAWKDIDTSLSDTGSDLTPAAAAADIAVSDGGDTQLASVAKGKESFGLGWQDKLPTPSVKGDTASYNLGSGQTLSVTALAQGFSENIELTQQPDNNTVSYRIPLNLAGLKLSQADSGHLLLKSNDGDLVAEAPAPMMWDASKADASGESAHQERVNTTIDTASDGSQTLVLTPDKTFLATATYPVTVDPTSTLAVTTDTWVQNPDYPDSQTSSQELKSGTYDGGADTARSYLKFNTSAFTGKHIQSATMSLYSYYSSSCSSTAVTQAKRITSALDTTTLTWGAQPSTTTTNMATNGGHWGYNSSCPANWSNWTLTGMVQDWANGTANNGIQLSSSDEKDSTNWRRFRSANYTTSGYAPKLVVTYNSYPAVPTGAAISPSTSNAYNGHRYVTSLTPTLSSKVTDPDGANVQAQYEITADPAYADTTYSLTAYGKTVASGSTSTLAVPSASAFPSGSHLRYRARAYDGTDFGSWSGYTTFVLNTTKPVAPTVSCDTYTQNGWTAKAPAAVNCTLDTTSTDGAGYQWGLDDASLPNTKLDTTNGTGGDPQTISVNPAGGWHTLYARTIDSGGNLSTASTAYSFGVGADGAAILSPQDGDTTARRVTLAAKGLTTYTGVTWQYRRGETDSWHTVPVGAVTASGSAVSAWPVAVSGGMATKLVWNTVSTLAEDGVIQLRAAFTDGTTTGYSQTAEVTLDRDAGTALTNQIGPGQVNELTGDFTLSATDASAFAASVDRTFSSRTNSTDTEGQAQIFGPGWTSAVSAESSDYTQLRETSGSSVEVLAGDGSAIAFTKTSSGGWQPEIGAESLKLTYSATTNMFTLTDTDAGTVVFAKADPASTTWTVYSSASAVDDSTVTVFSTTVDVGGKKLARPRYVVSPTGAATATTCQTTPSTKGCRVLEYVYAPATTATSSTLGDYVNQVSAVKLWATTPGASASTSETLASYAYNASGQLRQVWDPRISPSLKTEYTYGTDGRVATYTKPGELPWTFAYGTAGSALTAGPGMLLKVSRAALAAGSANTPSGTAATTVVYDVPVSGTAAPYQMDNATVAAWGQDEAPTDATAFFPADSVPASSTGGDLAAGAYARATISYINANGAETNTVSPGGAITTTEYDLLGNESSDLTAGNRELALGTSANAAAELAALGLTDLSTAERAQQLSTVLEYSADGTRVTDEYGPLHQITLAAKLTGTTPESTLAAGTVIPARAHTSYAYDEGAPADAAVSDLVTSSTTGAAIAGYATDAEAKTTTTTYDWSTGSELATTGGGESAGQVTSYDSAGRVATTRTPKSSGSDAGTLVYTYYDAHATGACASTEWDGLLCRTAPAAAVSGGGTNPAEAVTTVYTYGRWGQVVTKAETANGVTRTTTTASDTAGRPTGTTVTGGTGTGTPATTITYDGATGQVAGTTANGKTSTSTYDALGRTLTYSDGSGSTSSFTYDILDRPVTASDSVPSTTTYAYDATTGQARSVTDSVAGTFTAGAHDADGALTRETLPGGYTLATTYDPTGNQTSVTYADSSGATVLSDSATYTIHGKQTGHTQTDGETLSTAYGYDASGRLAQATDDDGTTTTSRAYAFDTDDNRTSLTTTVTAAGATPTTSSTAYAYDTAGRLIAGGYTYDAFGRTTQLAGKTLAYYTNDLVASETVGSTRTTWGLDSSGRLASSATAATSDSGATWSTTSTTVNHYSCGCDTPSWTVTTAGSASTVSRNVADLSGSLAATTGATGGAVLQLANLHGDISVRLDPATSAATVQRYDEYGNPLDATAAAAKYGALGAYQKAGDGLAGYTLMGVRLYDPTTGRFLQSDPVYGGNTSAYIYPADPIGQSDTSGELNYRTQTKKTKNYTIGISRNCTGHSKCSLTWYVKLKSIWKKYGALKFVYTIVLPMYYANRNQSYGHLESGTYVFHGSWGVPNGRGRPESDRGKYRAMGMTFWFDWTDNVEFSGKFTVMNICVRNPTLNVYGLFT
ncbi:DNRLRE domain-containing protein [Streptomyces sp. SID10815]|uniref:DNRLRE domain-containing protein n=1 Tax=Streptomyces sp. SID10815 TaxID=2706027 RepID=UPI0023B28F7B|nr:DNRLRE domain-containing protein [Streptomyces sp. SID10815]